MKKNFLPQNFIYLFFSYLLFTSIFLDKDDFLQKNLHDMYSKWPSKLIFKMRLRDDGVICNALPYRQYKQSFLE